jgi:hypothetical protein
MANPNGDGRIWQKWDICLKWGTGFHHKGGPEWATRKPRSTAQGVGRVVNMKCYRRAAAHHILIHGLLYKRLRERPAGSSDNARDAVPDPLSSAWRTAIPWLSSMPPKITRARIIKTSKASTEACPCWVCLRSNFDVDIIELGLQGRKDLPQRAAHQADENRQDYDVFHDTLSISIV